MAGLIGLTAHDIDVQDALGAIRWDYEGEWIPHPVVRLTTTMPVGVNSDKGRSVVRARWGFNVGEGRPIGNARDDRLVESRMWASLLKKPATRCLVAATGVYEMVKNAGGGKTSLWFRRVDGEPIVMPGLAGERNVKGEKRLCAAIVTTEPNAFFGRFHARQVCEVNREEADAWLAAEDAEAARKVLRAPAVDAWEAVPVDDRIFQPGRREMEDLVPVREPIRWEGA